MLCLWFAFVPSWADGAGPDRSPVDLVLALDDSWLVTANQTSDSLSLVRIADGVLIDEVRTGRRPAAVALHPDGQRVLVTCSNSGELQIFNVEGERLQRSASIRIGYQPTGIATDTEGKMAYVAMTDADQVAIVDLERHEVVGKIQVGRWPRYLALSNDGKRMAVGTSGDRGITVVDVDAREPIRIDRFVGLNIGHMQFSHETGDVYFPWMVYRRNPITEANIRLGWVMASRLGRMTMHDDARREAISLDPPGKAVADPHGLALTSDGKHVVVSASGSHELLVYQIDGLPFQDRGSTDHIDPKLLADDRRFYRIELGGRPMGLRIGKDDRTIYVANYLDNSVQVVDLESRQVARTLRLGGNEPPTLARRGEAIFFDARRSLDQWYSCHSCHYEGGANAVVMDTFNDGTPFTFKTVPPLYELDKTGPWTWHGTQKDLHAAMKHSLSTTMLGPTPSDSDADALVAYLSALAPPPNPYRSESLSLSDAASRGEQLFRSPISGCSQCHTGTYRTDGEIHDLGLSHRNDAQPGFNTPALQGVFRKVQLLHDGRSPSLQELLNRSACAREGRGRKSADGG
jgi:YVTN family beta-propeller protein